MYLRKSLILVLCAIALLVLIINCILVSRFILAQSCELAGSANCAHQFHVSTQQLQQADFPAVVAIPILPAVP